MRRILIITILTLALAASESFSQMGHGMMRYFDAGQRLNCAEEWLKKAIELHELHMKDPKTTTDESQKELMRQIRNAYECVAGKNPETGVMPHMMP
ncbi:MAG: hypothetical protein HY756_02340 [Nitrospirae bacterium]|nr:hypothetical protein [Nitrospirota bacterium]